MATLSDTIRVRPDVRYRANGLSSQLLGRNDTRSIASFPTVNSGWNWSDGTQHVWTDDNPAAWTPFEGGGEGEGGGGASLALGILFEDLQVIHDEEGNELEWED